MVETRRGLLERDRAMAAAAGCGGTEEQRESESAAAVSSMRVQELKAALAARGLPTSGKKAELSARLLAALTTPTR